MKKVLIISYYWPPAGGPGVQRWLKFSKYLPDFGVEPVLYVPEHAHYPLRDDTLVHEIPKGIKVLKKPIFEPYSLAQLISRKNTRQISSGIIPEEQKQGLLQRLMLFIRGNFFIPDARKYWIRPSVRFLMSYLEENQINTVITTGPPHSMHLIGLKLKEKLGIRWIADFRDPWTQIGYHKKLKLTSSSQKKHVELELKVLHTADELITTSFTTKQEFEQKTRTPVTVITNGFDQEKLFSVAMDEKFTLSHIGSLLSGRNPLNLWEALRELIKAHEDFARDFRLKLVGAVGEPVLESIAKLGLDSYLDVKGYVSHTEALQLQRSAQLLLLIEIDAEQTRGIIPGKLFEYIVSSRPVLAVGPDQADIEKIIAETGAGAFFRYSEKEAMKKFVLDRYREYQNGNLRSQAVGVEKYSRKSLTRHLAQLIKKTI